MKKPQELLKVKKVKPVTDDFIWNQEHAPIEITAMGRQIPEWRAYNGVAPQPVTARDGIYKGNVSESIEQLTLIPVGCTKIRIVAFPVVK